MLRDDTKALAVAPKGAAIERPTTPDQLAAAWLIGYSGATRRAYATDLREWAEWLDRAGVEAFAAHRAHVEAFARELELLGRARSTVARKLAALAGYYTYAEDEGLVERSPLKRVRRPQ